MWKLLKRVARLDATSELSKRSLHFLCYLDFARTCSTIFRMRLAILAFLVLNLPSWGADVEFHVVTAQGYHLALAGEFYGPSNTVSYFREQSPSSGFTQCAGSIRARLTSTSIEFTGGSSVDPLPHGFFHPLPGGGDGRAPADYAGYFLDGAWLFADSVSISLASRSQWQLTGFLMACASHSAQLQTAARFSIIVTRMGTVVSWQAPHLSLA